MGSGRAARTALVVGEESEQAAATRRVLQRNGFAVYSAGDGSSALAFSRRHDGAIDLLLTDFLLPGMPGVELAEAIRRQRPGVAVIYMSEFAADDFDAARPPGLIGKPLDEAELLDMIRRSLPDV